MDNMKKSIISNRAVISNDISLVGIFFKSRWQFSIIIEKLDSSTEFHVDIGEPPYIGGSDVAGLNPIQVSANLTKPQLQQKTQELINNDYHMQDSVTASSSAIKSLLAELSEYQNQMKDDYVLANELFPTFQHIIEEKLNVTLERPEQNSGCTLS